MKISLIAAYGKNREIGKDNKLLWHISDDLKNFKKLTLNHILIMGRKTYESIGKPLPKRMTIVLTRQKNFQANGCLIADTIERALELAKSCKDFNQEEIFIAGGGEIYSAFLPLADFLYISEVESSLEADTYFPPFSDEQWELVKITQYPEKKDCFTWSFKVFKRN